MPRRHLHRPADSPTWWRRVTSLLPAEWPGGIAVVRPADHRRRSAHHEGVAAASAPLSSTMTPEVPRLRAEPRAPLLEWSAEAYAIDAAGRTPRAPAIHSRYDSHADQRRRDGRTCRHSAAGPCRRHRCGSAWARRFRGRVLTIKICRLSMSEVAMLPTAPLLAFLLLQNGGYSSRSRRQGRPWAR